MSGRSFAGTHAKVRVLILLLAPVLVQGQSPAADTSPPPGTEPLAGETVFIESLRGVITVPDARQVGEPILAHLDGVDISRTPLLSDPAAAELIKLFLNKPMSFGSADRLCSALRVWLRSVGQPFVAVFVPPQEVTAGVLRVVVQRARLEGELNIEGEKWFSESSYRKAVPLYAGDEIDAAAIRAGVERLNNSAYRRVTVAAEPGNDSGTTRLILRAQEARPWEVVTGWNNSGTAVTDESRATAGFTWGNAFGRGDALGYNFSADPELNHSRSHSANYGTSFESGQSLSLFGSWSKIESALPEPLTQEGTSWQTGVRYSVPFATTASGWTRSLSFGADFKYSDNTLEFAAIPITDNVTHIAQVGVTFSLSRREAEYATWLTASAYASPGGVTDDNEDAAFDIARPGAKANYAYGRLDVGYTRQLPQKFSLSVSASVQAASGALLGTEQLNGGGVSGVRGYRESSAFGDAGALVRTELHMRSFSLMRGRDVADVFFFIDGAVLHTRGLGGGTFELGSSGPGLNYRIGRHFSLSGAFGWQFRELVSSSARASYHGHFNANVSF
ncbi:ShlB/FhaC/HecB family hemolysin secretion/activation protein [Peristeroidobacter agariperforans]|uniref:ShlB/FhaC/HecB family hemolysin secretion/activation protein n=1 Tax=Peristeroidobacter agariperforans TaxID=268404 RepID=UPI00101BB4DB|nr:ShlB/FhaC/HecB family hemolysin secretion/activation protein [Peristeroidobacter agariperforans]